jgi:hypothetical protein
MTESPSAYSPDLVPRPDPTRLTNEAIDRVTGQYRREISQLKELLDERFRAQERATELAVQTIKERLLSVNEFRAQQGDIISTFLPRNEYSTAHQAISDRIDQLRDQVSALELRVQSRLDIAQAGGVATHEAKVDNRGLTTIVISVVSVLVAIAAVTTLVLGLH